MFLASFLICAETKKSFLIFNLTTQELTLISHLVKNLVERADKDKDGKVTIEEILAFDDFEFVELAYNVFAELGNPGERLSYLVKKHKVLGHCKTTTYLLVLLYKSH